MADLRYTVDVDTRGAKSSLNGLKSTILGVGAALGVAFSAKEIVQISARFEDLRTSLKFLFRDTANGAQAFEEIKKFATESVFSVEDLTNTVIKLKAAGLTPTITQLRLFADVASVSADSVGALQAITDLFARTTAGGLGLEDLNRLQDRGIPVFDIIQTKVGLARREISEFGKSAEGAQIILKALTEGLEETFSGASAARANNLSQAFSNLEDALSNTADAIGQAGLNKTIGDAVRSFTELLEANRAAILVISEGLVKALVFLGENLKYIGALLAGVFAAAVVGKIYAMVAAVLKFADGLRKAAGAAAILQAVTGVGLIKLVAGLTAATGAIIAIDKLSGDAQSSIDEVDKKLEEFKENAEKPLALPEAPSSEGGFQNDLDAFKLKQDELTRSTINYFKQYKDSVRDVQERIAQEVELLKLTESQAKVQRELNNFTSDYYATIRPLQEKITELKLKDTDAAKTQLDEIEKQIAAITELYNTSYAGLKAELELREQIRREEEKQELLAENRLQFQRDLEDLIRESRYQLQDLNLTPFQREIEGIRRTIDDKLVASFRRIKSEWQNNLISADEYIEEMNRLEKEADKAFETIVENAKQQREIQRSFTYGWRKAFESFADNATNAAKQAEKVFNKSVQGIEDTIVNFVKTGKFEFRSLVADILETLLRSQIQQTIAQIFQATKLSSGFGNLSNPFAGFFANGGMIPAGSFGVVGERGPELVTGPAQVTPLTGGGNVTYNINAVDASSFKQLVARDPEFIHAVALKGGRSIPGGR